MPHMPHGDGKPKVDWLDAPAKHDFDAAESFLSLIMDPADAAIVRQRLLAAAPPLTFHPAKDLLRAAGLPLLPEDNKHVAADLAKIRAGQALSPVLLLRGAFTPLTVADGYHRIIAAYLSDSGENTEIPAVIV